VKLTKCHISK